MRRGVRAGRLLAAGAIAVLALVTLVGGCSGKSGGSGTTVDSGPRTTDTTSAPVANEPIALDPNVVTGVLPNGLTYFIRANNRPGGRAQLRLAVNAGSALETADQSGVAHFLEHMLFNGTAKYKKNDLVAVLQKGGSDFGADINAYTSYDETVYQLNVKNTTDQLALGLDILHEWLTAVTLAPADVAAERGVVLDEYRVTQLTSDGRVNAATENAYLAGTTYSGLSPIGTDAAIKTMTSETLRRFFDTWYRPDNVGIVVVGDIDPSAIEKNIKDLFSSATARGDSAPRPQLQWKAPGHPTAVVTTDTDLTKASVELSLPTETAQNPDSVTTLAANTINRIAMMAISDRLTTDITRGTAPFNDVQSSDHDLVRPLDAPSVVLSANNDDAPAAATALLDEFARVLQFGFTTEQVQQAVDEIRSTVEADYAQRDTVQDTDHADGLVSHFLNGHPFANADKNHQLLTSVLDGVDASRVNRAFKDRYSAASPLLTVAAKSGVAGLPGASTLERDLAGLATRSVKDRVVIGNVGDTLMSKPSAGVIKSTRRIPGQTDFYIEPTEVDFANGVRVILNPSPVVSDQVAIYAISPGGFSLTAPKDAPAVWLMNEVNSQSGFGTLDAVQVDRILKASTVDVSPYPAPTNEFFSGSTSKKDLELAMEVLNRYITASNFNDVALKRAVARNLEKVADPGADPDLATQLALNRARYADDPRFRVALTADDLNAITADQLRRVWGERFGNPADFVFIFSGDLDLNTTIDLASRYLGTIPTTPARETAVDVSPPPPPGVVLREVHAGSGDTAQMVVQYAAGVTGSPKDHIDADLLSEVLNLRLTAKIREELGASYAPSARVAIDDGPPREALTFLRVSGAPTDMPRIAQVLQAELADLRKNGPTADEMTKAIATVKEHDGLVSNEQIVDTLARWVVDRSAIDNYAAAYTAVTTVSATQLRAFAIRALPAGQYIQVTQLPR